MNALAEISRIEDTKKFEADGVSADIIQLPDGRCVIKQKLTGRDFFHFQRQIMESDDAVEGMQQLILKLFKWADGSAITIADLEDEEGIGFRGCSLLTEHMTELFGKAQVSKKSLKPA